MGIRIVPISRTWIFSQVTPESLLVSGLNNNLDKADFVLTRRPGRFETQTLGLHRSCLAQFANRRAHLCRFCRGTFPVEFLARSANP
jgi:hypothetical protein